MFTKKRVKGGGQIVRDGLSDIIDEDWQLPDWKARTLYRRLSLCHLSSPEIFRRRKQHPP